MLTRSVGRKGSLCSVSTKASRRSLSPGRPRRRSWAAATSSRLRMSASTRPRSSDQRSASQPAVADQCRGQARVFGALQQYRQVVAQERLAAPHDELGQAGPAGLAVEPHHGGSVELLTLRVPPQAGRAAPVAAAGDQVTESKRATACSRRDHAGDKAGASQRSTCGQRGRPLHAPSVTGESVSSLLYDEQPNGRPGIALAGLPGHCLRACPR